MTSALFKKDLLPVTKSELTHLEENDFEGFCHSFIGDLYSLPTSLDMIDPAKRRDFIDACLFPDEDASEKNEQNILRCYKKEMQAVLVATQLVNDSLLNPENMPFKKYNEHLYYMDGNLPSGEKFRINLFKHERGEGYGANIFLGESKDFITITSRYIINALGNLVNAYTRPTADLSDFYLNKN